MAHEAAPTCAKVAMIWLLKPVTELTMAIVIKEISVRIPRLRRLPHRTLGQSELGVVEDCRGEAPVPPLVGLLEDGLPRGFQVLGRDELPVRA